MGKLKKILGAVLHGPERFDELAGRIAAVNRQVDYLASVVKDVDPEWLKIVAGLLVFSFGVHLTIFANIGLAPWDCLGMGLAKHTPFNYGVAMTLIAITVLLIDVLMKEKIGFGTIIDACLTGNFVQMFNSLNPFPLNQNVWFGIGYMLAGFVFMALGMWIYMSAQQGCGPRDALLVGLCQLHSLAQYLQLVLACEAQR